MNNKPPALPWPKAKALDTCRYCELKSAQLLLPKVPLDSMFEGALAGPARYFDTSFLVLVQRRISLAEVDSHWDVHDRLLTCV